MRGIGDRERRGDRGNLALVYSSVGRVNGGEEPIDSCAVGQLAGGDESSILDRAQYAGHAPILAVRA